MNRYIRQSSIDTNWTDGISHTSTDTTNAVEMNIGFNKIAPAIRALQVSSQRLNARRQGKGSPARNALPGYADISTSGAR